VDYVVKPFDHRLLLARVGTHTTLARLSRGLQTALDEHTRSLQAAHRRMRELDVEMALAEERERRRLADELHDTTIQQLVLAQILLAGGPGGAQASEDRDNRLRELLDCSVRQLRTLVFELSPPVLYQGGLFPALEWLAGEMTTRWPVRFECSLSGQRVDLPDALRVMLFNGARELMTNVGKHARATRADVHLAFEPGWLTLRVSDNGVGAAAASASGASVNGSGGEGGFGLFSLRSRVELLGGGLDLQSTPGKGTEVSLRVPVPNRERT
jgi:signal transduction histidine kinase